MKYRDLFSLSVRSFKTNTSRSILTVLGLGIGIGAVIFLVSLGYGLQNIILDKITTADALLTLDVSSGSDLVVLDRLSVEAINNLPEVVEISPVLDVSGQIIYDNQTIEVMSQVIDKPFFRLSGLNLDLGREFTGSDSHEVIISSASARILGFDDPANIIGKKIEINLFMPTDESGGVEVSKLDRGYEIVGVVINDSTSFAYIPILTLNNISVPLYSGLKVRVESEDKLEDVRENIIQRGLLASSVSDTIEQTKKIFKIIQIVLGVFGFIALLVSAIGMFNTMTITLLERTKEIGIMRAVGVSNIDIAKLFLTESVVMGSLGGASGIFIGVLCGKIFNIFINILAKSFGGQALSLFQVPVWFVLFVLGFSILTGFLTGLYPARRAAGLNPLEALRYK